MSAQIRDISERKLAESQLAEREARFRAIFDHAAEAIVLMDATGTVLEINGSATDLLPAGTEAGGEPLWMLDWWGAESSTEVRDGLKENVQEAAAGHVIHTRAQLPGDTGSVDVDFSLIPVMDEGGQVINLLAEARKLVAD